MEKTHTLAPTIKWAQRKDKVYMTVEIRDIKNEKIDLQPANLSFVGESDEKHYEFKIDFFEDIDVEVRVLLFLRHQSGANLASIFNSSSSRKVMRASIGLD